MFSPWRMIAQRLALLMFRADTEMDVVQSVPLHSDPFSTTHTFDNTSLRLVLPSFSLAGQSGVLFWLRHDFPCVCPPFMLLLAFGSTLGVPLVTDDNIVLPLSIDTDR
jgi:hypothetical protein